MMMIVMMMMMMMIISINVYNKNFKGAWGWWLKMGQCTFDEPL